MLLKAGSIVFILPVIVLIIIYSNDMGTISDCLALEMTYNPDTEECAEGGDNPPTFYIRHTWLVNIALLISIAGAMAMTWGMLLKGPTRAPEER